MDNKNNYSNNSLTLGKVILVIIGLIGIIYGIYAIATDDGFSESTCYWCGRTEQCHQYDLQYVDGYNPNGSFKFGHKFVEMSSKCADEARNSGKYTNVTKT